MPIQEPASVHGIEKAFARGEEQALRAAYRQHGNLTYTYCQRTLDKDRANDVTQEVFISAWRSRHRSDPADGALIGWLFSITRNRILDNVRAERRQSERRVDLDLIELPTESEIEPIGKLMVADALLSSPDRSRRVVMLHYFEDLTNRQNRGADFL